ncbi:MAG: Ig-like domain-containing protein [Owenweeksia sp.]|nr:Ig-like domain-containing protein [Owenweeksia sp.]
MSFWYVIESDGLFSNGLAIYYRNTPGGAWQLITSNFQVGTQWVQAKITLPNPSSFYQLQFRGSASDPSIPDIIMDNVRVQEGCAPLSVTDLTLVNASTNNDVTTLANGSVIDKSQLNSFSVRADVCDPNAVGSVRFFLDGNQIKNENLSPYTINGDNSSGYNPWNIAAGNYMLKAIPYSNGNGNGASGIPKSVSISIIDSVVNLDCNGDTNGTASFDDCGICSGGNTGIIPNSSKDNCGICFGDGTSCSSVDSCCNTPVTSQYPNSVLQPDTNIQLVGCQWVNEFSLFQVTQGREYFWSYCSADGGASTTFADRRLVLFDTTGNRITCNNNFCGIDPKITWTATYTGLVEVHTVDTSCSSVNIVSDCADLAYGVNSSPACDSIEITELVLIDTYNLNIVDTLTDGYVINKAVVDSFSIRAETCDTSSTGSVQFFLDGNLLHTENIHPYTIQGDDTTGYNSWNIPPGIYDLNVVPYSGYNGSSFTGKGKTISLTVIDSLAPNCSPLQVKTMALVSTRDSSIIDYVDDLYLIDKAVRDSFSIQAFVCDTNITGSIRFRTEWKICGI